MPDLQTPTAANTAENSAQPPITVSLSTYALAAIATSLGNALTDPAPELQFLQQQLQAVTRSQPDWKQSLQIYTRQPSAKDYPLIQLAKILNLQLIEVLTIALAAAVEEDVMVGRSLARLQAPLGGSRPTLGLVASAFAETVSGSLHPIQSLVIGVAVQSGLLSLLNEAAPLPERTVSVPLHLWLALSEHDGHVPETTIGLGNLPAIPLSTSTLATAEKYAVSLKSSTQRVLVLRTGSPTEGRSVAQAIAQTLDLRPLLIETDQVKSLGPWLLLRQLLPVFCLELAPGERKLLPPIPFYVGPILVLCGPDGSVEATGETALSWVLPVPDQSERQQLWQEALGNETLATSLAQQHRHSTGRIAQLGRLTQHQQLLQGDDQPQWGHVVAAARTGEGAGLDALAQALTDDIPDDALVMTPALQAELQTLLLRCRSRDRLVEGLGVSASARYHPGVRALLVGPSGTGKTLAAGWLATQLGLPLYRVDLASTTSKYIGETEKNLAQLLARAEQAEIILLFDEADSLFGKRTDVKDSNDRFANAQTNYLLQRIESYDGITLLTSNSRSRFDAAFARRLDMIIEFPLPGPEERRSLWRSHLGDGHHLTQMELNQLAASVDLTGGNIRNAVLAAAVVAQSQERAIEFADVVQGVASEYRKLGRQLPTELKGDRSLILS
ncbi:ATP-binding protein [Leptolyngbyaceae cyanobacterium UHCC 1019]